MKVIRATCSYEKIRETFQVLDGHTPTNVRCYPEMIPCETSPNSCNNKVKTIILDKFFSPFGNELFSMTDLEAVDDRTIAEGGSYWEKGKEWVKDNSTKASDWTEDKYDKTKDWVEEKTGSNETTNETATETTNETRLL